MKLSTRDVNIFKGKIRLYYKQFKKFMMGTEMPILDNNNILIVDFGNRIGEPIAQIITPKERSGKYILKIDYSLYYMNHILKSILFHEFTHILDYSSLANKRNDQELLIKLYSEYHASQIQMKALLNYKSCDECEKIMLDDIIYDVNTQITIYKYFFNKRNEILDILNNSNLNNEDDLRKNTYNLLYYLGSLSIIKKHCTEELGVILDISDFFKQYGNELKRIVDYLVLFDIKYNTEEFKILLLEHIAANYLIIMNKFNN